MSSDQEKLFQQLDSYDWGNDKEFQAGLSAILGSNPNPSQVPDLTTRARCFYYARKTNQKIDYNAYRAHTHAHSSQEHSSDMTTTADAASSAPAPSVDLSGGANPNYPTSFADIVALIQSGQAIPGIKEIPPTVLADEATQPTASRRKKPWEKDEPKIAEGEGTFGNDRDRIIPENEISETQA